MSKFAGFWNRYCVLCTGYDMRSSSQQHFAALVSLIAPVFIFSLRRGQRWDLFWVSCIHSAVDTRDPDDLLLPTVNQFPRVRAVITTTSSLSLAILSLASQPTIHHPPLSYKKHHRRSLRTSVFCFSSDSILTLSCKQIQVRPTDHIRAIILYISSVRDSVFCHWTWFRPNTLYKWWRVCVCLHRPWL